MTDREAMKQALEALEMLAKWEHPASHITTKSGRIYPHHVAANAATALRTAIEQAEKQEPAAWNNAAIRLGEELSSIGPDGYYNMTAEQWLDWAMDQKPRGKNSLPAAQRQWTGLTDDDIEQEFGFIDELLRDCVYRTEAKLKEKNT
jgi:hypothetical protein